jgi:hypothetical protein
VQRRDAEFINGPQDIRESNFILPDHLPDRPPYVIMFSPNAMLDIDFRRWTNLP